MFKKLSTKLLGCCLLSLPLLAYADLTISNHTKHPSTSKINNGRCSSKLGRANGVTEAGDTKTIPQFLVDFVCSSNKTDCKSDVYMTDDCSGSIVSTVTLDTHEGIKTVVNNSIDGYFLIPGDFRIDIYGGPLELG